MNLREMIIAANKLPPGDYAECGVYRGDSAVVIADQLPDGANLWLFDSFEGHAEPGPHDDKVGHPKGRYSDTKPGDVIIRLPQRINIVLVIGYIPHSFRQVPLRTNFRFVHVDVDHYEPTRDAVQFFRPRMVPGGMMRFDDYGAVSGATKAINELFRPGELQPGDWRYEVPLASVKT